MPRLSVLLRVAAQFCSSAPRHLSVGQLLVRQDVRHLHSTTQNRAGKSDILAGMEVLDPRELKDAPVSEEFLKTLTEEQFTKFKTVQEEIKYLKYTGHPMPKEIPENMWLELLVVSRNGRMWSYHKQNLREYRSQTQLEKHRKSVEATVADIQSGILDPSIITFRNKYMLATLVSTMETHYNHNLANALKFQHQKLFMDMSYADGVMGYREQNLTKSQLLAVYAHNRRADDCFNLVFCNMPPQDHSFTKKMQSLSSSGLLVDMTEKSYLDLCPLEELVYLTPDSQNVLREFRNDETYIIGGLVDIVQRPRLTYSVAKRHGVRHARLPLETYVDWGVGSKSLTLNQIVKILEDVKETGDWKTALESSVPSRKLKSNPFGAIRSEQADQPGKKINYRANKKSRILGVKYD